MLVRSRWLDIGHSFLRFYWPRWIRAEVNKNAKRARLIYSYLDWTSVVNKGFIVWPLKRMFSCGTNKGILGGQNGPILQHFFGFAGQFIDWVLLKRLHNGDLCSKATATTLDNVQFFFFLALYEKPKWSWYLIRMVRWWLIAATVFCLCSIYTITVGINWNFYRMIRALLVLSR